MSNPPRLFFAHANGFAPGAYEPLLMPLIHRYKVEAPALLPLRHGRPPSGPWSEIAEDLAPLVDADATATVGVGHSLGAVALLMLAATRPTRFSRLVLIEPPTIPAWLAAVLGHAPAAVRRKSPMAEATRRRADTWTSFEQAFAQARARPWYARLDDAALRLVLQNGLQHDGQQWRPSFRTEWEATLYERPTSVWPLLARRNLPPITVLRGAQSAVFPAAAFARWRRLRPDDEAIEIPSTGHLLPLEAPARIASLL